MLKPVHITKKLNVLDQLSRPKQAIQAELTQGIGTVVFNQLGWPNIDLFATLENKRLLVLSSPFPDPLALGVDALMGEGGVRICVLPNNPDPPSSGKNNSTQLANAGFRTY